MKDIVIESDIVIDFLKGMAGAKAALEEASGDGVVCLSSISAAEVVAAADKGKQELTEKLVDSFRVLPVGKEVALLAGKYFSDGGRGKLELGDCIVAAAAVELGAVLVTKGLRNYPVSGLEIHKVSYRR